MKASKKVRVYAPPRLAKSNKCIYCGKPKMPQTWAKVCSSQKCRDEFDSHAYMHRYLYKRAYYMQLKQKRNKRNKSVVCRYCGLSFNHYIGNRKRYTCGAKPCVNKRKVDYNREQKALKKS